MDYTNLCVKRSNPTMVKPFEPTPSHTLHLSPIDNLPVLRCNPRILHVFKNGPLDVDVASVIRRALSKALVPYYPLAGRLKLHDSDSNLLQLDCSSEGVWFVAASSTFTLSSLDYFDDPTSIPLHLLLPPLHRFDDDLSLQPLVQMQVTQFACGGFVIGFTIFHSISDGIGAAQFLTAVGELARGCDVKHLNITPSWHRDFFPSSRRLDLFPQLIHPPLSPNHTLQHSKFDISMDCINHLKKEFHKSTAITCSTFETVVAIFWRSRTRAIYHSPNQKNEELKLVFFADCRRFVEPPLPKGFYGNCFFPITINASSKMIVEASISEVVKLIQEAKSKLRSEFEKYMKGLDGEDHRHRHHHHPYAIPEKYTTLLMSEWGKLGFNENDYGWGKLLQVVPTQGSPITPAGTLSYTQLPNKGIRLTTWCVVERHRQLFINEMSKLLI